MSNFPKPCLGCSTVVPTGEARCPGCQRMYDRKRNRQPGRQQYSDPGYLRSRKALLAPGARCWQCGTQDDLTVDHIIPLSRGGTNHPSNLQVLCRPHNSSKGNREESTEFPNKITPTEHLNSWGVETRNERP